MDDYLRTNRRRGYDLDMENRRGDVFEDDEDFLSATRSSTTFSAFSGESKQSFTARPRRHRDKLRKRVDYLTLLLAAGLARAIHLEYEEQINTFQGTMFVLIVFWSVVIALPLAYAEAFVGDYTKLPATSAGRMLPAFSGMFALQTIYAFICTVISVGITIIDLDYLLQAMTTGDPWNDCSGFSYGNNKCFNKKIHKFSHRCWGIGKLIPFIERADGSKFFLPTAAYQNERYFKEPLGNPLEFMTYGTLVWLFVAWMVCCGVYRCLKCVRVLLILCTSFFTIILLIAIGMCTTETNLNGVGSSYDLKNLFERLGDLKPWHHALGFALSNFSAVNLVNITYSSRLTFRTNRLGDMFIIWITILAFNYIVLSTVVAYLGVASEYIGVAGHALKGGDFSLMNVVIPFILPMQNLGRALLILFYLTLFILEMIYTVVLVSAVVQSFSDSFGLGQWRVYLVVAYMLTGIVVSFIYLSQKSFRIVYTVEYKDFIGAFMAFLGLMESVTFFWAYGYSRLEEDIQFMYGKKPWKCITFFWMISPIVFTLWIVVIVYLGVMEIINKERRPVGLITVGVVACGSILVMLISVQTKVVQMKKDKSRLSALFKPAFDWGPPNAELRRVRKRFRPRHYIASQPVTSRRARRAVRREPEIADAPGVRFGDAHRQAPPQSQSQYGDAGSLRSADSTRGSARPSELFRRFSNS